MSTPTQRIVEAALVADLLGETDEAARKRIEAIALVRGRKFLHWALEAAKAVRAAEPTSKWEKSARYRQDGIERTLGGTFFVVAKRRMSPEQKLKVFGPREERVRA